MRIAVTGHRPNKLWGYDYNQPAYYELGRLLRDLLLEHNATHIISGMALGVDTIFALVGLKLRDEGILPDLQIEAALPCRNQASKWPVHSQKLWNNILADVNKVTLVSDEPYKSHLMQVRNEYMVNNTDMLIAVWDGTSGGTANCVSYAKQQDLHIIEIYPKAVILICDIFNITTSG